MRCPVCSNRQGANRDGMRCGRCSYAFVFDPRHGMRLSDRRVINAAMRLGRGGALFAPRQVLGAVAARRRVLWWTPPVSSTDLDMALWDLDRLRLKHPTSFATMTSTPTLSDAGARPWPEPDIYDYGAERIVVVDHPLAVDLLVDARVHVTARAIIVDQGGYPARVTELARELVAARPDVPVSVLHSSGSDGEAVVAAARHLLGTDVEIVDLGLASEAPRRLRALRWARRLSSVPLDALPRWMLGRALVAALSTDRTIDAVLLAGDDSPEPSDGDYG